MYSVVLMAALTTGVDLPDLGRRGGGCCGCQGGGRRQSRRGGGGCCGCHGGGYGGGMGYGGGCMGMGMGMGMGYGGGGCMGMGHGYGGGCMGMGMGYGGCMGMGMGMGYGGGGCHGGGGYLHMQGTQQQGTGGEKLKVTPKQKGDSETMAPAPATIVVELPADAKLRFDNEATTSTGSSRVFQSPALNPGKAYQYTLKAEVVRDSKPVRIEKVVEIKAGEIAQVALTLPAASVAQR